MTLTFHFFGDSLVDRPAIVVDDPHYDLPAIGQSVVVKEHQTAGFYRLTHQRLQAKHPEIRFSFQNYAVGGSNVRDVETQISSCEQSHDFWDVSFVCVGINDILRKVQGRFDESVELEEYSQRYQNIVEKLKDKSKFIFCIGESPVSLGEDSSVINTELKTYTDWIKNFCQEEQNKNVHYIDFYNEFERVSEIFAAYQSEKSLWVDGIHYSQLGNTLAAELIIQTLGSESVRKSLFGLQYEWSAVKRL